MPTAPHPAAVARPASPAGGEQNRFQLRFNCLFTGRGLSFPCDAQGTVNTETLSELGRQNLLRAHQGVGRDYGLPQVVPVHGAAWTALD